MEFNCETRRRVARWLAMNWLAIFCAVIFYAGCDVGVGMTLEPSPLEGYDMTFPAMGSSVTLSAYASSVDVVSSAFDEAKREIERVAKLLTDYDPDSELNRLHGRGTEFHALSPEMTEVLVAADTWYRRSEGRFDAALGTLTRLWRTGRREGAIPSDDQVQTALAHAGWAKVELDAPQSRFRLRDPDVRLDLGGIAAGYIVDRAYQILQKHGLTCCLVNSGGDIRCGDPPPGRKGWKIEVASIERRGQPVRRILLANAAVTTSGDLWQYTTIAGVRRSHILDPRTGYGVVGPMSVTLIAPTCLEADAGATAVCLMGKEAGLAWVQAQPNYEAIWLSRDEVDPSILTATTRGFPQAIVEE